MLDESPPAIDELVAFLGRHSPLVVQRLEQAHGAWAGASIPGLLSSGADAQAWVRAEVAIHGLTSAIEVCKERLPEIRERLQGVKRWQFYGQVAAIVGGASIFGTAQLSSRIGTYLAASLTLAGSLASAYSRHLYASLQKGRSTLFDSYRTFVESEFEARQLREELTRLLAARAIGSRSGTLVQKANYICGRITKELARI